MKKLILQTIIISLIIFSACKKDKKCPAFNVDDLKFIPYSINDTIKFTNQQNEVYEIYIGSFDKSEEYNYECHEIERVCSCINSVDVVGTDSKTDSPYTFLKLEQSDASDMQYYKYQVADFYFEFDFRNELPNIQDFEFINFSDSLEISNTWYYEVVIINNFDDPSSAISTVYFNQVNGILKFDEKQGEEWSLAD